MVTKFQRNSIRGNSTEVVISGLSCRLPESNHLDQFERNLLLGVNMTTADDRRWTCGLYNLPTRSGKIGQLDRFDANFFRVHAKQANRMDPALRLLLELSYEAILDSGTNPVDIRGSKTGVFIGYTGSESEEAWIADPDGVNGYDKTGCHGAMFANRISYTFDFKGPSLTTESKCTSGMLALEQAVMSIRLGKCDAAVVGGVSIILKPQNSIKLQRMGFLSPDGKTKAFDSSGDGYAASEGAVVIFIQKSFESRRSYASIVHIKSNMDGFKDGGVTFPDGQMKTELYKEVYSQAGIDPLKVSYVETNGTGILAEDREELNSMAEIFCQGRDPNCPLLIGAVKPNIGHTDAASGLCSVIKALLAIHNSLIPKTLSFNSPNPQIPGLIDGRFKVVVENTPWDGGLVGVNSFSCFGSNVHVILKGAKTGSSKISPPPVPWLIPFSGSTRQAVEYGLERISEIYGDPHFVSLLHQISKSSIIGHSFRGFGIYSDETPEMNIQGVLPILSNKNPIWFIFSGMGTQWNGMGRDMMKFKVFKNSIMKSAECLAKEGIKLVELLTKENDEDLIEKDPVKEALNSFVCITSIQIALVDLLRDLGIHPDGVIGHSVGETACGYADDCFTLEQTIMASYVRGKALLEMNTLPGAMAAVGLTWEEAKARCPQDIYPACHNSKDSVTVSGPVDSINAFVDLLQSQGIFARHVNSSGRAFHSKYIADSGNIMRNYMEEIIPEPKERSSRWISSSIPMSDWGSPLARTCSAAYHVNNSLSPVLFHDALSHIPQVALVIEIAPHSLLQAILKRSLGPKATILGLMNRSAPRNDVHFLTSIGKLYGAGHNPNVAALYDKPEFPVPVGTPMISPLVEWDHSATWDVPDFKKFLDGAMSKSKDVEINLEGQSDMVGEQLIFPGMGYLFLVWKTLAQHHGTSFEKLPVIFQTVYFHHRVILEASGPKKFRINILRGAGSFEIRHETDILCSGQIQVIENILREFIDLNSFEFEMFEIKGLMDCNSDLVLAEMSSSESQDSVNKRTWNNPWVRFMERMFQFGHNYQNNTCFPTTIQKLIVDPTELINPTHDSGKARSLVPLYKYNKLNILKCPGVEIRGLKFKRIPSSATDVSNIHLCRNDKNDINELEKSPSKFDNQLLRFCNNFLTDSTLIDLKTPNNECLSYKRPTNIALEKSFPLDVKSNWALENSATIPAPCTLIYYALIIRAELQPRESILIDSGSSSLGQAGISLALSMNCNVFTTVKSEEEVRLLKSKFPTLNEGKVCLEESFEQNVFIYSEGRGVNVVLCASKDQLQPFLRCVSRHGRFIRVGDMDNNDTMGMAVFLNNIAFHGVSTNFD